MSLSHWADKRDVPDTKWGKETKPANCECTKRLTCRACCKDVKGYFYSED